MLLPALADDVAALEAALDSELAVDDADDSPDDVLVAVEDDGVIPPEAVFLVLEALDPEPVARKSISMRNLKCSSCYSPDPIFCTNVNGLLPRVFCQQAR